MTIKGGTTPACAACKYQRRRCTPNCPLAPYFKANDSQTFLNVHKLFGVSNITKILKRLNSTEEQDEAMRSIIYEADMRERFPVHGCCAVIQLLRTQLQHAIMELQCVKTRLAECKEQQQMNSNNNNNEIDYVNYEVNQFFTNENSSFLVDNNISLPGSTMSNNLDVIQARMDALGIQELEETTVFPSDLERMQFCMRIVDRQPHIEQNGEIFESRLEIEEDSSGTTSNVMQMKPWI